MKLSVEESALFVAVPSIRTEHPPRLCAGNDVPESSLASAEM
jgi:hypothetical protein